MDRSLLMVVAAMVVIAACRDAMTPRPEHSRIMPAWSGTDTLVVSTSTTGSDLPAGYTVITDGGEQSQPIGTNDTVVFPDLAAGDHTVELSGVPANCTVSGDNPRTVTIPDGGSASTTFDVSCAGAAEEISGTGQLGSGSPTPGSALQTFTFDVRSDLTGTFSLTDYSVSGTLREDPATLPGTGITAFRVTSSACAEFDGIGQVDEAGQAFLTSFTVGACDNGPAESGLDFISINSPAAPSPPTYSRFGNLTGGDIAKTP